MLRHKTRIDIEAKGCSGETFLAAVELLFKKKPAYCIFENVTGAPWYVYAICIRLYLFVIRLGQRVLE